MLLKTGLEDEKPMLGDIDWIQAIFKWELAAVYEEQHSMVRMKRHTRGQRVGERTKTCMRAAQYTLQNPGEPRRDSSTELTVETRPGSLMPHFNLESTCVSSAKQLLCISYWISPC